MTQPRKPTGAPASTGGQFVSAPRPEAAVDLAPPPAAEPAFVTSVTCPKCRGNGDYQYASGALGVCSRCSGLGTVEGDKATLRARRERQQAIDALNRAAGEHSREAYLGLRLLSEHEPDRLNSALASHAAGRPDLLPSLAAYWQTQVEAERAERRRLHPPTERSSDWMSYDDLPENGKDAIRVRCDASDADELETFARGRQWQYAQVPVEDFKARVMAADPDLVADHGTFEAYHEWYCASGDVPDHGESHWPAIEAAEGSGEYLDDGWHRTHSYIRAGAKMLPILRSRVPVEADAPPAPESS